MATWLALSVLAIIREPLVWTLIAAFLAVGLHPLVVGLERLTGGRRGWAIALGTLILLAGFVAVLIGLIPPLIRQTQELITNLPHVQEQLARSNTPVAQLINSTGALQTLSDNQDKLVTFVTSSFGALFGGTIDLSAALITIFFLLVYFLAGGPRWIAQFRASRYGGPYRQHEATIRQMAKAISAYVVGNGITSVIAAVTGYIMLVLLGIGAPLPLAVLYGIFDIIPIIGATLGGILLVGVTLFKSFTAAVIMLIYVLIYQQFETSVLQPRVYGRALQLPDVAVMLAAMYGGALAGLVGALLAIPLAACLGVAFRAYLAQTE
ncbi:MAG TPA: AI-2E family transporter, partial [Candidatus Saccharimonas sp.]|nr:AI-2E family transporter [Candidatus Saccharimonas sp.]